MARDLLKSKVSNIILTYEDGTVVEANLDEMTSEYRSNNISFEEKYGEADEVVDVEFDAVVESVEIQNSYVDAWNCYADTIGCHIVRGPEWVGVDVVAGSHNDLLKKLERGTKIHVKTTTRIENLQNNDGYNNFSWASTLGGTATKDLTEITIIK